MDWRSNQRFSIDRSKRDLTDNISERDIEWDIDGSDGSEWTVKLIMKKWNMMKYGKLNMVLKNIQKTFKLNDFYKLVWV